MEVGKWLKSSVTFLYQVLTKKRIINKQNSTTTKKFCLRVFNIQSRKEKEEIQAEKTVVRPEAYTGPENSWNVFIFSRNYKIIFKR